MPFLGFSVRWGRTLLTGLEVVLSVAGVNSMALYGEKRRAERLALRKRVFLRFVCGGMRRMRRLLFFDFLAIFFLSVRHL
jgi:hypothetical protein